MLNGSSLTSYHNRIGLRRSMLFEDHHFAGVRRASLPVSIRPVRSTRATFQQSGNFTQSSSIYAASGEIRKNPVDGIDKNTNQLRELNNQLAQYISKIHILESKNKSLKLELACVERNVDSYNLMVQEIIAAEITELSKTVRRIHDEHNKVNKDIKEKTEMLAELHKAIDSPDNEIHKLGLIKEQEQVALSIATQETKIHTLKKRNIDIDGKNKKTKTIIAELTEKLLLTKEVEEEEKENVQNLKKERSERLRQLNNLKHTYNNELSKVNENPLQIYRHEHSDDLPKLVEEIREDHERKLQQTERTLREELVNEYKEIIEQFQKKRYLKNILSPISTQDHAQEWALQTSVHELQRNVSEIASTNIALHDTLQQINKMIVRDNKQAEFIYNKKQSYADELEKKLNTVSTHCTNLESTNALINKEVQNYHSLLYGTQTTEGMKYFADKISKLIKEQVE